MNFVTNLFWSWECKIYKNQLRFVRVIDKFTAVFFMPHSVCLFCWVSKILLSR